MKILVNATIARMGGGIQKAVEFIRASSGQPEGHRFFFALPRAVAENLDGVVEIDRSNTVVLPVAPSRPIGGAGTRRALRDIEARFQPDVVFTLLGPAYMRFRSPHLMGFAGGWVTHPNSHAWRTLRGPVQRARFWAWCRYVAFWAQFADRWVLESHAAADGLARLLTLPRDRFHVVPNVPGGIHDSRVVPTNGPYPGTEKQHPGDVNVLVFSYWYPHKNLEIVPAVSAEVRKLDASRHYRFFLTFDPSLRAWREIRKKAQQLGVETSVVNLGPIRVGDGPRLYGSADLVFLPTLLETHTATYPEAMAYRKPIVTTDLPFAHDLCGDAALYAAPNDARQAAEWIVALAGDGALRAKLVRNGEERLALSCTPQETYTMVLEALEQTARVGRVARSSQ